MTCKYLGQMKSGLFQFLGFQGTKYCSCTIWVVKRNSERKGGKLWKLKHFIRPWVKNYSLCCEYKQLSHLSQMTKNIILYLVRPWYFLSEYSLKKYLITIQNLVRKFSCFSSCRDFTDCVIYEGPTKTRHSLLDTIQRVRGNLPAFKSSIGTDTRKRESDSTYLFMLWW